MSSDSLLKRSPHAEDAFPSAGTGDGRLLCCSGVDAIDRPNAVCLRTDCKMPRNGDRGGGAKCLAEIEEQCVASFGAVDDGLQVAVNGIEDTVVDMPSAVDGIEVTSPLCSRQGALVI